MTTAPSGAGLKLDILGRPADPRVGAGRQQPGDTPERQPVSVKSDRRPLRLIAGLGGRLQSGELVPAAPAQPPLFAVMVTGFDDNDTTTTGTIGRGEHGQSEASIT